MIAWLAPWAMAGVGLLAGPLLVHMLLRRNARRVMFPTTRFLQPTRAAAVRFRRPSDVGLLILRSVIVLAAVLACAQPVLLAAWRTARWNQRTARAVVLDTSRSMPSPSRASRLADQELQAFASAKFAADNLPDAIARATDWLAHTPPARREVVVISDFQRGALAAVDLAAIPAGVGVRFIRAGSPSGGGATLPVVSGWRGADWQPSVTVREDALDVAWSRVTGPRADNPRLPRPEAEDPRVPPRVWLTTREPAADAEAAARAVAAAASFGVPAGSDEHRVVVAFRDAPSEPGERPIETAWMLRAAVAIRQSSLLRESGVEVTFGEVQGSLVVRTDLAASTAAAPAVIRASIAGVRSLATADVEAETAVVTDAELASWRREPAEVDGAARVNFGDTSESRWLWAIALLLIGIETWIRRPPADARVEERADAA